MAVSLRQGVHRRHPGAMGPPCRLACGRACCCLPLRWAVEDGDVPRDHPAGQAPRMRHRHPSDVDPCRPGGVQAGGGRHIPPRHLHPPWAAAPQHREGDCLQPCGGRSIARTWSRLPPGGSGPRRAAPSYPASRATPSASSATSTLAPPITALGVASRALPKDGPSLRCTRTRSPAGWRLTGGTC